VRIVLAQPGRRGFCGEEDANGNFLALHVATPALRQATASASAADAARRAGGGRHRRTLFREAEHASLPEPWWMFDPPAGRAAAEKYTPDEFRRRGVMVSGERFDVATTIVTLPVVQGGQVFGEGVAQMVGRKSSAIARSYRTVEIRRNTDKTDIPASCGGVRSRRL
jgi:hypothetical protein